MPFDTDLVTPAPPAADCSLIADTIQLLLEGDFQTRWEATKRISALGKPAIAPLVTLLHDEDLEWEIRWFAARTLGYLDDEDALAALIQLLQETQDAELIAIAAEGLSRFGEASVHALVQLFEQPSYRIPAIQALASIRHSAALPPLLKTAQDRDPAVRTIALSALGDFRDARVEALLLEAIKDPVATVRQEAITHLGLRPHLQETINLVGILLPGLWDINLKVNQATAIALGRLGTETAVISLARVLASPHTPEPLQISIVRTLGWVKKESALSALLSAQQSVSVTVQLEIIEALSHLDEPGLKQRAGEALCHWLDTLLDSPEAASVKPAIAFAIGCLQHQSARALLQHLSQDADERTRLYAQAALRQLKAVA